MLSGRYVHPGVEMGAHDETKPSRVTIGNDVHETYATQFDARELSEMNMLHTYSAAQLLKTST